MKKILLTSAIIFLTLNAKIFASNSIDQFVNTVSNIFADNIYCPEKIVVTKKFFYPSDPNSNVFLHGYSSSLIPSHESFTLYFTYATFAMDNAHCNYGASNTKLEYTLIPSQPTKPNTDSISNNWGVWNIPYYKWIGEPYGKILICRHNSQHCPFMNY